MHDTCNAANASAKLIIEAKNASGVGHFGAEVWANMPESVTSTFDGSCFHHTVELPIAAYNRLVATFIAATGLSKEFAELKSLNPMTRLEVDGMSVLLNIAKLPDKKYAKSLALPWQTFAAKRRVGKM